MQKYEPETPYPLTVWAGIVGLTPKSARLAAEAGKVPGAFRPYEGAHWKISGAALNAAVAKLGTTATKAQAKKQRKKSEKAALAGLAAAV